MNHGEKPGGGAPRSEPSRPEASRSDTPRPDTPQSQSPESQSPRSEAHWTGILNATGSPLKMFALMVLVCNAVFAVAAASRDEPEAFVYTLHMFLAIVASFVLIALWSPRSFYNPKELLELKVLEKELGEGHTIFPEARPLVPTLVLAAGVVGYALYHLFSG